jgi:ABC-type phosphate/phosphonate transport system substrate-binding protein
MSWVAHLPMYDFPEARPVTDRLWRAIAERLRAAGLREVPDALTRFPNHEDSWRDPRLLLGQSCGYPAMTAFRDDLRIIATPIHAAPGCEGASHCSFFVVPSASPARELGDLRGRRFALNSWDSNTGMNLPRLAIAPLAGAARFFSQVIETGSHAESLACVVRGEADAAAIDCVTHAMIVRYRPELTDATRILARTESSPALPFVTARSTDEETVGALRRALADALRDPGTAEFRQALFLADAVPTEAADYAIVLDYEAAARGFGYARLA